MKRIIVFFTALMLLFTQVPVQAAHANDEETQKRSLENIFNTIEDNLKISSDGIEFTEIEDIILNLDPRDIEMVNNLSREQGNEKTITKDSLIQDLEIMINNLNKEIENGELLVLDNNTFIDPTDTNFYIQGGSTYDERKLWGNRRYMSTVAARDYVASVKNAAAVATGVGLASVIFGPIGAIPATANGATALWCSQLANRIEYHNSRTNRGIIADLYWVLVFSIRTQ